ncbi:MAG TPA: 5'-nucleotidase C-terminal domain-containing protein [Pyrinomonadaceae bacterium]|jgi:2',3'-cyclic-nucleotide 2'-phosphodiesterase/3'-nucleotidase
MSKRASFRIALPAALLMTIALLVYSMAGATAAQRVQVVILSTTDMHGNIYPIDYYTNKPDGRGLAKLATAIKQARKESPNLLLLDSGDTIQGTPLAYYHNKKNNAPPDPMMLAMSALKYDAMAVGNHEYNFGLKNIEKARREANFPWLSSNTYKAGTEENYYAPYIVKEVNGVRVGILGLTTPGIPNWENPQNYAGLEFRETVSEARKWVPILREKERVDLVVISMHMGIEEDLRTGEPNPSSVPNENAAVRIAREVPGIDVILMGHTHREIPSLFVNGVLLAQANHWGRHLARVDVYLDKVGDRWRVAAKSGRTIPMDEKVQPDPEILALAKPYDEETQAWLGRVIGESPAELTSEGARFQDSAILDLIQRVQLDAGKADVSMTALFNAQARIPRGPVTVRDIAGLYIYENTLVTLEVTGQQLKDALEHSAKYFLPFVPGKLPSELVNDKIPSYNFDIAEGVTYDLDVTKPAGSRIQNLRYKGKPLAPTQKLKLVTNNYRVNGGGGYEMYKGAPVVYRSSEEIRELIVDWVERNKVIPAEPTRNWRLLPAN